MRHTTQIRPLFDTPVITDPTSADDPQVDAVESTDTAIRRTLHAMALEAGRLTIVEGYPACIVQEWIGDIYLHLAVAGGMSLWSVGRPTAGTHLHTTDSMTEAVEIVRYLKAGA